MNKTNATAAPELAQNWMAKFGIQKGEYLSITKPQLQTCQYPYNPVKVQVWATGMLATAGYQGELAKTQHKGHVRPLTSGDISRQLYAVAVAYYKRAGVPEDELRKMKPDPKNEGKFLKEPVLQHSKETIRKEIARLEDDGRAERRANGKPLRELAITESRKLAGNNRTVIELYFFLRPRPHKAENVLREWQEVSIRESPEQVVQSGLPNPPIHQILKVFNFGKDLSSEILATTKDHGGIITDAWTAARDKFVEVVRSGLPEGVAGGLPEGVRGGGALERIEERTDERDTRRAAARVSSPVNNAAAAPQETRAPAAAAHPTLQAELNARGFQVHSQKILSQIVAALNDCPLSHWLKFLDKRISQGKIGAGLLPDLADDCRLDWQVNKLRIEAEQQRAREIQAMEFERQKAQARGILANPNAEDWEREWAEEVLKETQVA